LCAFASACLCFAPAEFVSGTVLLVVSALLHAWDQAALRREAAAAGAGGAGAAHAGGHAGGAASAGPAPSE
jgi:hypothetical protein